MDGLSCGPCVSLKNEVRIDNIACKGYGYLYIQIISFL